MDGEHVVLFSSETVARAVKDLAVAIDSNFGDSPLVVLTVLKGAAIFSSDLVRAMRTETELSYITASSYSDGFTPGESLRLEGGIDLDVAGRDVLIVDDIIDTGRTLAELAALVETQGPRSVSTVALINKTSRRSADREATYHGLQIGEELIYGYGLDWDERFRDLPFIALATP
jgi:hypoxanthine phosphoribosyltransferase